jgi:hypothetical protein
LGVCGVASTKPGRCEYKALYSRGSSSNGKSVQLHLSHCHTQAHLQSLVIKMDSHIADDKLKELHIEDTAIKTNRDAKQFEIDPAAEKKLLRKIDLHVVPILWFLFM